MQEKYTEDIDKLDSFYQEAMGHASIEPPATMWDKIGASHAEQKKPASVFKKRYLLVLLLLLLLISSTGIFLYLRNNSENTPENIQEKNPIENTPEIKENTDIENNSKKNLSSSTKTEIPITNQNNKAENNKPETSSDPVNETKPLVDESKPVVITPTPAAKPDSVITPKESPKKKLNFREKHTQNIKADSLRPLFVPVK